MSTTRYQRHPDLRLTALDEEGVVLHLGARRYFTVNATGLRLLQELAAPRTLTELSLALTAEFAVTEEDARETTRAFLAKCIEASVVQEDGR